MASRVQGKANALTAQGSSVAVTLDAAPTQGNVLVAIVAANAGSDPGLALAGWTQIGSETESGTSNVWAAAFYKTAGAGESATVTGTWSVGTHYGAIVVEEYAGVDTLDGPVTAVLTGNSASITGTGAAATASAVEVAICLMAWRSAQTMTGVSAGWTLENQANSSGLTTQAISAAVADKIESATETPSVTGTIGNTRDYVTFTVALKSSGGGPQVLGLGHVATGETLHGLGLAGAGSASLLLGLVPSEELVNGVDLGTAGGPQSLHLGLVLAGGVPLGLDLAGSGTAALALGLVPSGASVSGVELGPDGAATLSLGRIVSGESVRGLDLAPSGAAVLGLGRVASAGLVRGLGLAGVGTAPLLLGAVPSSELVHGLRLGQTAFVRSALLAMAAPGVDIVMAVPVIVILAEE